MSLQKDILLNFLCKKIMTKYGIGSTYSVTFFVSEYFGISPVCDGYFWWAQVWHLM